MKISTSDILRTASPFLMVSMHSGRTQPELVVAAVRLMFVIDHRDVTIGDEGDRIALFYGDVLLAHLSVCVPGESVTVTIFENGQGLTVERTITREPIDSPVAMIRQRISKLAKARSGAGG